MNRIRTYSLWLSIVSVILIILATDNLKAHCNTIAVSNHSDCGCGGRGSGDKGGIFRKEALNSIKGEFEVTWVVDLSGSSICFEVVGKTRGFIFLGFGRREGLVDLVLGGVFQNGSLYFQDRHSFHEGKGTYDAEKVLLNSVIDENAYEDWTLIGGWENQTHTKLSFRRLFNSEDLEGDIEINDDTLTAFWGFGGSDDIFFPDPKNSSFGSESVNLLDLKPEVGLDEKENVKVWELRRTTRITPGRTTSYWCTVFKGPPIHEKHHAIRFDPVFQTPKDRQHIHHFVLYKCVTPWDLNTTSEEYFTPLVNSDGGECYESPTNVVPVKYCRQNFIYTWAYGGKDLVFPDHVGFPIGEEEEHHYMLEVHYDNPERLTDLEVTGGINIHYTPVLRENDAGLLMLGYNLDPSLVIPPKSSDLEIYGHCSSNCTSEHVPKEGIRLFGILPHSHLLGRKISTLHYRNGEELRRITDDENFDFKFQQTRLLANEVNVMPGDHLIIRCSYDNQDRKGSSVGGFSTREEMCLGFAWYYPRIDTFNFCTSVYPMEGIKKFFGVEKLTHHQDMMQPIIVEPTRFENKTLSDVMDEMEWTSEKREKLQSLYRDEIQSGSCSPVDKKTMVLIHVKNPSSEKPLNLKE